MTAQVRGKGQAHPLPAPMRWQLLRPVPPQPTPPGSSAFWPHRFPAKGRHRGEWALQQPAAWAVREGFLGEAALTLGLQAQGGSTGKNQGCCKHGVVTELLSH